MDAKFFSVTKLIDYIKTTKVYDEHKPKKIFLWYEHNDAFTNKFNQQCIKPIALTLKGETSLTLTHKTLLDTFDGVQPIVSFTKSKLRCVPKVKWELCYISIETEQKEFDGKEYYPNAQGTTTNMRIVKNIIDKKINEDKNDIGDDIGEFI